MRSILVILCLFVFVEPADAGIFRFRRRVSGAASCVSDCAAKVTSQHFSAPAANWRIEPKAPATQNHQPCQDRNCESGKTSAIESTTPAAKTALQAPTNGLRSLITNASYTPPVGQIRGPGEYSPPNAQMLGELVRELPEDAGKWHTVVVTDESLESQRLLSDFASHPQLQKLLAQTHHTNYKPNDPMFRDRYQAYVGEGFPQVWILKPDGKRVYKASGKGPQGVPAGDQLAAEIAASIAVVNSDCPNCPVQPYQPSPHVAPVPPRPDQFVPDLRPPNGLAGPSLISFELIFGSAIVGLVVVLVLGAVLISTLRPQNQTESGP